MTTEIDFHESTDQDCLQLQGYYSGGDLKLISATSIACSLVCQNIQVQVILWGPAQLLYS